MGLLEPQHLILLIMLTAFTSWGYQAGKKRTIGAIGGLLLGFFLSFVGIIIVYCTKRIPVSNFGSLSAADELKKYKELLDDGAITESEYNIQKERILNN